MNCDFVSALDMLGFSSKEELIGKSGYSFIAKKDHQRGMGNLKKTLEQGSTKSTAYTFLTKDGRKLPAELSASIIKDSSGKPSDFMAITKDIANRNEAEETLRASKNYLEKILNSVFTGVVVVDEKTHEIVDANPKALKTIGASKEHVIGKICHNFICPAEKGKCPISDLGQTVDRSERVLLRANGERIPILKTVTTTMWRGHKYLIESLIDITERKKAEEALRESEEKYRNLFENARDVIFTGDLKGNITNINSFVEEYGFKREKIVGKNMLQFVSKKYWPRLLKDIAKISQGNIVEGEIEIITPKGKTISEYRSNPIRRGKKVVGFQASLRNITERKKLEEKLRQYSEHLEELVQKRTEELLESEKRYSVLVEEASDGVAIIQDGKIIFANKKTAEILGYSKDEIIEISIEKLVVEKDRQLVMGRYPRRLRDEKVPATYEVEALSKTGESVPTELSATRINYQGRPADLVVMRDIRERKRLEEQRLKLEKLATIGEIATMVGHDLRNPLQSIENATYYLNNELPRLPPSTPIPEKALEMLQVINDSVSYADKIIKDLKDFSAPKKPILMKTDVNAIVKETLSQVEAPENVELITELGHLPDIKADKDMIKRVFMNLVINGIQAMENVGRLKVSSKKTKGFVEVSFRDTGTGISRESMNKLFTPFFSTKAKGMGMGLPICARFVEIHGGSIEAASEEGKGTTFTVKLPTYHENGGENH